MKPTLCFRAYHFYFFQYYTYIYICISYIFIYAGRHVSQSSERPKYCMPLYLHICICFYVPVRPLVSCVMPELEVPRAGDRREDWGKMEEMEAGTPQGQTDG